MTERVAMTIVSVSGPVLLGFSGRSHATSADHSILIRRPARHRDIVAIATIGTGSVVERHDVHTTLVPSDEPIRAGASSGPQQHGLRLRTFRDTEVPFFWDRLASKGIPTTVLGFPFKPIGDDSSLVEVPFPVLYGGGASRTTALLQAFNRATTLDPAPRLTVGWLPLQKPSNEDSDSVQEMDQEEAGLANSATISAEIDELQRFSEMFQEKIDADHHVLLILGPRTGRLMLSGPRAVDLVKVMGSEIDVAPTVLDLLGEELSSFIRGTSLLRTTASEDEESGSVTWEIDDAPTVSVAMSDFVDEVAADASDPVRRRIALTYLRSKYWSSFTSGAIRRACETAADLERIDPSPRHVLWVAIANALLGERAVSDAAVDRLKRDHPDSQGARLAVLIPGRGHTDEEIDRCLDANPPQTLDAPLLRGLWGRAALRCGRAEEGIAMLGALFRSGYATRQDRLKLANAYIERNAQGDAELARQALISLPSVTHDENGRAITKVLRLRAIANARIGDIDRAVGMLEGFLANHPLESKISLLLEEIRRMRVPADED